MVWFGWLDGWIGLCGCLISWVVLLVSRLIGWVLWLVSRLVWCGWLVCFCLLGWMVWFGLVGLDGWLVGWLIWFGWMDGWVVWLVARSLVLFGLVGSVTVVSEYSKQTPASF